MPQSLFHASGCILSKFYIKPQPRPEPSLFAGGCILSKFYIKPQRLHACVRRLRVVSYRNSTSNHNSVNSARSTAALYLIEILHQTTTLYGTPFLYAPLYLIEILHQTTTIKQILKWAATLYLIEILHQTTTPFCILFLVCRCILSKFYIKPQPSVK